MYRAVAIDQQIEIAVFERSVGVAHELAVTLCDQQYRRLSGELAAEPPRVALFDVLRQKEARRVLFVMLQDQMARESGGSGQVLLGRAADVERRHPRSVPKGRARPRTYSGGAV